MKIITLLNEKGGVGKTSLATHVAAGLAIRGYKVVLADTDMQANATIALGLQPESCIYDLFVRPEKTSFKDVLRPINKQRLVIPEEVNNMAGSLFVIPSNDEARNIPNSIGDPAIVLERFRELRGIFDYLIVDTSPTANLLHSAIYSATDAILYPTRLEEWSFVGLNKVIARLKVANAVRNSYDLPDIEVIGIVPTMAKMRTVLHQVNMEKLREAFGTEMVLDPLSSRTVWAEAASSYVMLYAFDPGSVAASEVWRVVDHVEGVKRGA